jgi:hypothetical protein
MERSLAAVEDYCMLAAGFHARVASINLSTVQQMLRNSYRNKNYYL